MFWAVITFTFTIGLDRKLRWTPYKQQPSQVGGFLGFLPQRATGLQGHPQPKRQIFLPSTNSTAPLNSAHCFLSFSLSFFFFFGRNSPKHNHTCASFPFSVIASLGSFLAFNMTWTLGWLQTQWIPSIPSLAKRPWLRFTYSPRPLGTHCWESFLRFPDKSKDSDRLCPNPIQTKSFTFFALTADHLWTKAPNCQLE